MASVTGSDELVTKTDLSTFYQGLLPYLGGMPEAVANKFSRSDIYSTTEKMIGTWTNGKPLYQKAVEFNLPSGTAWTSIATLGTSCVIVNVVGAYVYFKSNNITQPLPWSGDPLILYNTANASTVTNGTICAKIQDTTTYASKPGIALVQYTKTTDSATAIGVDTDYSTTEKIIGTWIDGKPIYQKTIETTLPTCATDGTIVTKMISVNTTVGHVINSSAYLWNTSSNIDAPVIYINDTTSPLSMINYFIYTNNASSSNKNKVVIGNSKVSWSGLTIYITLQYTKP